MPSHFRPSTVIPDGHSDLRCIAFSEARTASNNGFLASMYLSQCCVSLEIKNCFRRLPYAQHRLAFPGKVPVRRPHEQSGPSLSLRVTGSAEFYNWAFQIRQHRSIRRLVATDSVDNS